VSELFPIHRNIHLNDFIADHREEAFKHFITSLKHTSSFAPAFTSLGIYYSEAANPPDPIRASKCFQKAFEIDAREGDAARRLAEGFAEEREWDLVEVIANRTIEGEGGFENSQEIMAGRYLPVNAWAWKASGVVHLVCFSHSMEHLCWTNNQRRTEGIYPLQFRLSRWPYVRTLRTSHHGFVWENRTLKPVDTPPPSRLFIVPRSCGQRTGCALSLLGMFIARRDGLRTQSSLFILFCRFKQTSLVF
jgi:hypothetical protein